MALDDLLATVQNNGDYSNGQCHGVPILSKQVQIDSWTNFYESQDISYPAEAVIRIFKGEYPKQLMPKPSVGDTLLDVGCGDGRHIPLFNKMGLRVFGTEVSEDIVGRLHTRLVRNGIGATIRHGLCSSLPFDSWSFDYMLAWNSCYYMSIGTGRFEDHVSEMHRVLKPGGWLVCSVPKPSCFIFDSCASLPDFDYVEIRNDHFGLRNGEIMRYFDSQDKLRLGFSSHFENFSFSDIEIDCFGLHYSWWAFTAKAKKCSHP